MTYLKEQAEADPLVVFIDLSIDFLALGIADTWIGDLFARLLLEQALERVRRVDPAVCVQHILGNVFSVHTVDGVAWEFHFTGGQSVYWGQSYLIYDLHSSQTSTHLRTGVW